MHYAPRRRKESGRWDYTCRQGQHVWPVGYCSGRDPDAGCADQTLSKFHTGGHETKEEALACYKRYLLDHYLRLDGFLTDEGSECKICGVATRKMAHVRGEAIFFAHLCDEHLNRESVEQIFTIGECWST